MIGATKTEPVNRAISRHKRTMGVGSSLAHFISVCHIGTSRYVCCISHLQQRGNYLPPFFSLSLFFLVQLFFSFRERVMRVAAKKDR